VGTTAADGLARARTSRREVLEFYESLSRRGPSQLLGVPLDADPAAARAAFLSLAKRFHPDVLAAEDDDVRAQAQAIFIALDGACRQLGGHRTGPAQRSPDAGSAPVPVPAPARDSTPPPARRTLVQTGPRDVALGEADAAALDAEQAAAERAGRRARLEHALETANAAVERGDPSTAVALLHEVLSLAKEGDRRSVRLLLARAYLADTRWRRYGLELLREMSDGTRPDPRALAMLGGLYRREGLLARAESTLLRALAADPHDPEARRELLKVRAERAGAADAAVRSARRAGLVGRLLSFAR
jgi:tetratricopeptide (TPR) repeat protein